VIEQNIQRYNVDHFEKMAHLGDMMLKGVNSQGFMEDGLSWWDVFGVPGQGATQGNAKADIDQLRGWNAAGMMANSLQAVMSTVHVFIPKEEADRLQQTTGEESDQASRITGIEAYQVPSDWVQAPVNHRPTRLLNQPNPWEDEAVFKCKISQQIETHGVACLLVVPNQYDGPNQIHVIPKAAIQAEAPSTKFPEGSYKIGQLSKLSYGWRSGTENNTPETLQEMLSWLSNKTFSARYVIPIGIPSLMHADDFFNPTGSMADFLDTDQEMHRSRRQTLKNNTSNGPTISKEPGATISPDEMNEIQTSYERQYGGPENAGKVRRIPPGIKVEDNNFNSREMEFASSTKQMREDMLALRGVPPSFFGVGTTAGYAGVVGEVKAYAFMRSQPLQRIVAGQITLGLQRFFKGEEKKFIVVFQAAQLDDPQQKLQEMQMHITAGVLTKGTYCDMNNLPRLGDERDEEIVGAQAEPGGMPGMGDGMTPPGSPDQPGVGGALQNVEQDQDGDFHGLKRGEFSNTRKGLEETLQEYAEGNVRRGVATYLLLQFSMTPENAEAMLSEIDKEKAAAEQQEQETTATQQLQQSLDTQIVAKAYFDDLFLKAGRAVDGQVRLFDEDQHPRDNAGRFDFKPDDGGNVATLESGDDNTALEGEGLIDRLERDTGFTYQPITGVSPTVGHSVAVYPENEEKIHRDDIKASDLLRYMTKHRELFENDDRVHFGGWDNAKKYDPTEGDDFVYLDTSIVIDDREEAVEFARERGQLKIYDLGAGEEIVTLTQEERRDWERKNKTWSKSYAGSPGIHARVLQGHGDQVAQKGDRKGSYSGGLGGDGSNPGQGVSVNRIDLTPLPIRKAMNRSWSKPTRRPRAPISVGNVSAIDSIMKKIVVDRPFRKNAEWREEKHPRDEDGQFDEKASSAAVGGDDGADKGETTDAVKEVPEAATEAATEASTIHFPAELMFKAGHTSHSEQDNWDDHVAAAEENMDKSEDSFQAVLDLEKGLSEVIEADVLPFDKAVERAGKNDPRSMILIAPIKGHERAAAKVRDKYGGDWSRLNDSVRATVSVASVDDIPEVMHSVQNELEERGWKIAPHSVEDKFKNPTPVGYRDVKLLAVAPNGQMAEIQVNVHSMLHAKQTEGHALYEEWRTLAEKADREDADKDRMDELAAEQRVVYQKAYEKCREV